MFLALVLTVIFIASIVLASLFIYKNGDYIGGVLFIAMLFGAFIASTGIGAYHAWSTSNISISISVNPER